MSGNKNVPPVDVASVVSEIALCKAAKCDNVVQAALEFPMQPANE